MATSQQGHLLRGTLELLLLQSLEHAPSHGYGIARRIETATDDALAVEEGSLYPALHRLEDRGLITARWRNTESRRRIREYAITREGRRQLAAKRQDWRKFVSAVARMIGSR